MRTNQRILSLRKKRSAADLTFDIINTAVMLGLIVVTFYPIWYVACASLSSSAAVTQNPGRLLWPEGFTIGAYIKAFQHPLILSGFRNILFILLCSLPLNLVMTLLCGQGDALFCFHHVFQRRADTCLFKSKIIRALQQSVGADHSGRIEHIQCYYLPDSGGIRT